MGRALRTPHKALPSFTTADALFLLRCDEAAGANDLTDALAQRTMTQTASPGAALSPFEDNTQAAGRGARTFNGSTQYAGRTHDADQTIFASRAWGWCGWFTPTSIAAAATILEFGEFGGTDLTGPCARFRILTTGAMEMAWRDNAGVARNNATPTGLIAGGVPVHLGFAMWPDRDNHLQQRLYFYVNGACVSIVPNRPPPATGTSARWIVGASRQGGTGIGTPGEFYAGSIDDLIFMAWSPTHEFFREAYANGIAEFYEREHKQIATDTLPDGNLGLGFGSLQEVHTRVLAEVTLDGSSWPNANTPIPLVNQTDLNLSDVGGLGVGLVKSVDWGDDADDQGPSATLELVSRFDFLNLSPVVSESLLATLFQTRRRIKIEQAFVPIGTGRENADPYYRLMADCWAMSPDVNPKTGSATLLGPHAACAQAWIEPDVKPSTDTNATPDRSYGSAGGTLLEVCIQNIIDDHDPALFTIVGKTGSEGVPDGIAGSGAGTQIQIRVFGLADEHGKGRPHPVATGDSLLVAGTTNFNGVKTANASTTSTVIQCNETSAAAAEQGGTVSMVPAHSYRGGKPTLWCPTSPAWNLKPFSEPPTKSVMSAISAWADEIGWHCRPRWDDTRKQFRLKLYDPRTLGSTIFLCADVVYPPESVAIKHEFQRTAGAIEYPSVTNQDNKLEAARYCVGYGDLARNGDRYYFRVVNDTRSLIQTSTDAQKELDAIKGDLSTEPYKDAEAVIPTAPDPRPDLGDLLDIFGEDGDSPRQMPSVLDIESKATVKGYRHHAENGRTRTTYIAAKLGGAGANAVARREWHHKGRLSPTGRQRGITGRSPNQPAAPTIANLGAINVVRYAMITWSWPVGDRNRLWDEMEVHYSTTTGFTPSSATLKASVRGTQAFLSGFVAGTTYFVKVIACDDYGNRSAPSAQASFVS